MMRKPIKESGEALLFEAMARSLGGRPPETPGSNHGSDAIYASEARGQTQFVASDVIPTDLTGNTDAELEAMGFELGDPCEGDEIFREARLPEGWKREATDHSMWSKIVDAKGRERIGVFYKAAFYDRSAHAHLKCRYSNSRGSTLRASQPDYDYESDTYDSPGDADAVVIDMGVVPPVEMHRVELPARPERPADEARDEWEAYWRAESEATQASKAWLDEHFPEWKNASAYWDD